MLKELSLVCRSINLRSSRSSAHPIHVTVYDVSRPESFKNIEQWLEEVDSYSNRGDTVKMLIGNKIDRVSRHDEAVFSVMGL